MIYVRQPKFTINVFDSPQYLNDIFLEFIDTYLSTYKNNGFVKR